MPRTSIAVQSVPFQKSSAITYTAADSTNGMMFDNDGYTVLLVKNGGASPINVTIRAVTDEAGRSVDEVRSVANGTDAVFGPYRPAWWNQRSTDLGKVYVDFSASASVNVAALKIQP